jgi:hypothetical protein
MKWIERLGPAALLVGIVGWTMACGSSPAKAGAQSSGTLNIECQVSYRPSMAARFETSAITLGAGNNQQMVEFDDLAFRAQYVEDQGEGRSFSIAVTRPDTGDELVRQLYQIDSQKGLSNQFIGGHGFTGLNYVYHPSSAAEVQYFCQAR